MRQPIQNHSPKICNPHVLPLVRNMNNIIFGNNVLTGHTMVVK